MKLTKGCANVNCVSHIKKVKYKNAESYCSSCGEPLVYVCKDCYKILENEDSNYCIRCTAKHNERNDKLKKYVAGVGAGAITVSVFVAKNSKKVIDKIKPFVKI